jgi:hypothetical protein
MLGTSRYRNLADFPGNLCSSVKPSYHYQSHFHYNCFTLHKTDNSHTVQTAVFTSVKVITKKKLLTRVLMMVHSTQDYWVSGLRPSSGILNTEDTSF